MKMGVENQDREKPKSLRMVSRAWWLNLLQGLPGVGRLRSLRPGSDAQVGVLVDLFVAFALLDGELSTQEADLILDMLRGAFPEADHAWLGRRLQRAVRSPRALPAVAATLRESYDDTAKLALGLQLYTLVDAAGRSERNRASFEVFMRRLGRLEDGAAILQEMRGDVDDPTDEALPFERLIFCRSGGDVALPPAAAEHAFRVYRAGDLVLVRNTGGQPLWIRGRSVKPGGFLRMRERQPLVVPGWSLSHEDLLFFLDVKRTGNRPVIFLERGANGLEAEKAAGKQSELRVRFGLEAEVEALVDTNLYAGRQGPLKAGDVVSCLNYERIGDEAGSGYAIHELRNRAAQSGKRFRLARDRQEYLVSNDASELSRGDLLLGPQLAPKTVLFIRYDPSKAAGELEIRESHGVVAVDGLQVRSRAALRDGSLIRLSGSQAVRCRFREGFLDEERTLIESLVVEGLSHDFGPGSRALDNVNFEVSRGEMLCIIGPSGSGKSTLLSVLSGQKQPTRGSVLLNGFSLYERREQLVPFITHMPQEEALSPQLTVREHLRYSLSARRPGLSWAERERRSDSMLAELGLQTIARRRVGSAGEKTISGGERSRLNLGLDLGSRAEVFLFDEPISGLSSKDSEHVAETLRSLARDKIVIASLHRPGAQVLRLFDKVLLLDSGGRMAYFGSPAKMVGYFRDACGELEISHPGIESKVPLGADFVFDVLETPLNLFGGGANGGAARKFPPTFWQERFESVMLMTSLEEQKPGNVPRDQRNVLPLPPKPTRRMRALVAIFTTHLMRSFLSKLRNRGTFYSTCLEAPVLAALVANTLRASPTGAYHFATALHIPAYLFLSATVAMFLGLTNSATEILRDRPVLRRERNTQYGVWSYVVAKFATLTLLAAVQCGVYLAVGNYFLEIQGMLFQHWLWLTLTAMTGSAMALVVSALVSSERAALTSVPLLLVPQMLLAGALVSYKEMNRGLFQDASDVRERGGVPVPASVMPLRYAYEALIVAQAVKNPFEQQRLRLQDKIDVTRGEKSGQPTAEDLERFDMLKDGLRRLLASGARDSETAEKLVKRISREAMYGTKPELEAIEVWPANAKEDEVHPAAEFFVNDRIDLLVREAETFRNDYRNTRRRVVFHALKKPLPWAGDVPENTNDLPDASGEVPTLNYCAFVLLSTVGGCLAITTWVLFMQKRSTK